MSTPGSVEEIDASAAVVDSYPNPTTPRVVFDNSQPPPTPLLRADINRSLRTTNWNSVEEIDASDAARTSAAVCLPKVHVHSSSRQQSTMSCLQPATDSSALLTPEPAVTWSSSCVPSCSIHVRRSMSNPSLNR